MALKPRKVVQSEEGESADAKLARICNLTIMAHVRQAISSIGVMEAHGMVQEWRMLHFATDDAVLDRLLASQNLECTEERRDQMRQGLQNALAVIAEKSSFGMQKV